MTNKNKSRAIQMFPYPARRGTMARQAVNDHIIRVRLPRLERRLVGVGCFVAGAYAATGLAFGFNVWHQNRVHNHSLPRLVDGCHVQNNAKACAEIQRRTELRP